MLQAARMIDEDGLAEHGILLEIYIDGPELNANFVLLDGEVLFLEVTDNFPCLGDPSNATLADNLNFAETVLISNSRLPPEKIEVIRSSLHHSLLRLGFRSAGFHVEAGMYNLSMRYAENSGDGLVDLVVSETNNADRMHPTRQPEVVLIEINARPPETGGMWATLYTYGVDMSGLQFLRALGHGERFKALSTSFQFPITSAGNGGGAQYWTADSMIPIQKENILVPCDFFERLYRELPEIIPHVSRAEL
jgi:biotin carboxylase